MTTTPEKKPRQMPKGGRKGGSVFPRIALKDAVGYARKLVSKTHTGPVPRDVILSGVIGAKGGIGNVRVSALKQYGFLKGDEKTQYSATELAKKISSAPDDELIALYRQAILKPTIFKGLFETFHGDEVTKAKLKQRAADLEVHPDETGTCVDIYVAGMSIAELVTVQEDQIKHRPSTDLATAPETGATTNMMASAQEPDLTEHNGNAGGGSEESNGALADGSTDEIKTTGHASESKGAGHLGAKAVFNVNVTLDSSLDIEKLQKQLELLKRFGAI